MSGGLGRLLQNQQGSVKTRGAYQAGEFLSCERSADLGGKTVCAPSLPCSYCPRNRKNSAGLPDVMACGEFAPGTSAHGSDKLALNCNCP